MKNRLLSSIILLVALHASAQATDYIDVLVATNSNFNFSSTDLAEQFEDSLNISMANSQISNKRFRAVGYNQLSTISTAPGDPLVAWGLLANPLIDQTLHAYRNAPSLHENGVIPAFDVIVLVTNIWASAACGFANADPEDFNAPINSEAYAFIIVTWRPGCLENANLLIPHEMGHILGAEHQPSGTSTCNSSSAADCRPNDPVPYNHPIINVDVEDNVVTASSLMISIGDPGVTSPEFSRGGGNLVGPFQEFSAGNSAADNRKHFLENTWNIVEAFRPLPLVAAPTCGPPNIIVTPLECQNYSTRTFLVTGNLPGYQITSARYEVKVGSNGIWQIILDGLLSCPLFDSGFGFYVKMFFTTPQGIAECQKYVSFPSCSGRGGDPPIQPW